MSSRNSQPKERNSAQVGGDLGPDLVKNEFIDIDEGEGRPRSKRQKRSRSNSQKLEETKEVDSRLKKPKKGKDAKRQGVAQFFEQEADEGEDEDEIQVKNGKLNRYSNRRDF